jgi:hypothetical protein
MNFSTLARWRSLSVREAFRRKGYNSISGRLSIGASRFALRGAYEYPLFLGILRAEAAIIWVNHGIHPDRSTI